MTQKPKKPSSRNYFFVFIGFAILLVGLFFYAANFQIAFFLFLAGGLFLSILLLFSFHRRLAQKQSQINIQKEEYFEKANILKADIEKEWKAVESFRRKIINYSQLKELTEKLSSSLTLAETSQVISSEVSSFFGYKDNTVILYLFHSQTGELGISSSQKGQMQVNIKSKKGDIFDQHVVKTLQPLLIEDTKKDFRFDIERNLPEDSRVIRSLISGPLLIGQKALGLLRVDSSLPEHFNQEDLRFLLTINDLASVAIENAQLYERIEDMAIRDSLTGLFLRRHMLFRLEEELKRDMRQGKSLAFLMIDIDHFKKYNDHYGHTAGDIVLKTLSVILQDCFNEPGNIICRYGGEEFSVVISECTKEKAVALAEQFRAKVEKQVFVLRRQSTNVSVSIGIACFPDDAQMKEELIYKADHALYRAKEQGRNCVCMTD